MAFPPLVRASWLGGCLGLRVMNAYVSHYPPPCSHLTFQPLFIVGTSLKMAGGNFPAFARTINSLSVAKESLSRNERRSCNFSGYGNNMEHIQREIRSLLLKLPGASLRNFIFLSEDLEVTILKGGIFPGSVENSEQFRTPWNLGSIHAFIQQILIVCSVPSNKQGI